MTVNLGSAAPAFPARAPARSAAVETRVAHVASPPAGDGGLDDALRLRGTADARVREALLALARRPRKLARGEHLFHAGSSDPNVHVVVSGSVKLYSVSDGGAEQVLGFCFPGDLFGLDVLGAPAHGNSAVALEPAVVRALPVQELTAACRLVPAMQQRIYWLLARRINDLHEQMMALGRMRAEERLAGFLLGLDARLATSPRADHKLQLSMTRYEIGCYLGVALETVSRLLRHFDEAGLTRTHGRCVQLRDLGRLRALAGLSAGARPAAYTYN